VSLEVVTALFMKTVFLVDAPCRLLYRYHVPEEPAFSLYRDPRSIFSKPWRWRSKLLGNVGNCGPDCEAL